MDEIAPGALAPHAIPELGVEVDRDELRTVVELRRALADRIARRPGTVELPGRDDLELDIRGARGAGLHAVWMNRAVLPLVWGYHRGLATSAFTALGRVDNL